MKGQKRARKSPEEKFLEAQEKEARKIARDAARMEKQREKELRKLEREQPPTEEELVKKYAKRVIMNDRYHGRVSSDKFAGIAKTDSINKKLWMDTDFFFSVVFQSSEQKMEFLQKSGLIKFAENNDQEYMDGDQIQIVNGLEYAKAIGLQLRQETRREYPTGNLDLMPFVLDNEVL